MRGCNGLVALYEREKELEKARAEIARLMAELDSLRTEVTGCRQKSQEDDATIEDLKRQLAMAKEALASAGAEEPTIPCAGCPFKNRAPPADIEDQVDAAQVILQPP